jgi:CBS domain-containing protein
MKTVKDVMNPFPIMVEEDTSLIEVFKIVREKHLSHLLVVSGTTLKGVISKEDLLNKMLDLSQDTTGRNYNQIILKTTPVSKIMTTELVTAALEDSLDDVVDQMLENAIHCIPIVNNKREPIGILNPMDLLKALSAGYENVV